MALLPRERRCRGWAGYPPQDPGAIALSGGGHRDKEDLRGSSGVLP